MSMVVDIFLISLLQSTYIPHVVSIYASILEIFGRKNEKAIIIFIYSLYFLIIAVD